VHKTVLLAIVVTIIASVGFLNHDAFGLQLNPGDTLTVKKGDTLVVTDQIISDGTIYNYGTIDLYGAIQNDYFAKGGIINNYGTINIKQGGVIANNYYQPIFGIINNYDTIINYGSIVNGGFINNICTGTITGPEPVEPVLSGAVNTIECQSVGGYGIPIDSMALLLAGVQGSALWMIPAIGITWVGIGFVTFKKSKKPSTKTRLDT
jgi:hypothetical protein